LYFLYTDLPYLTAVKSFNPKIDDIERDLFPENISALLQQSQHVQVTCCFPQNFANIMVDRNLSNERCDKPPKENVWNTVSQHNKYSQRGPSQFTTNQSRRLNTGVMEYVDGNTGNILDGNKQMRLTTNDFAGNDAEWDKVDRGIVLNPANETCTHKRGQVVMKGSTTALKNTHSGTGCITGITSDCRTANGTNSS